MTGRYPWTPRAFGDNAVTIWSWVMTLPFAVTVMAGYEFVSVDQPAYKAFLVALTVHVILGLVLLTARFTVLRPGVGRHRGVTAILLFIAIGTVRPFLALWISRPYGMTVAEGDLLSRVTINIASAVVILPLIAVVVSVLREHGEVQRRLLAAHAAVARRREDADRRVADLRAEYAAGVSARIDDAISSFSGELEPERAATLLRSISDDIIRPTSHALFHDDAPEDAPSDETRPLRVVHRLRRVVLGLQPARPLTLTGVYLALVFPHFLSTYGLLVTAVQTPVIGAIYLVGNIATQAIGSRVGAGSSVRAAAVRIVVLVACYIGVAAAAAAQNAVALSLFGFSAEFYWAELASYPFVAMVISIIMSVSGQLRADEAALSASLREQVDLASRAQRRLHDVRRRMAHVLHSTVQAELVAASLALRRNPATTAPGAWADALSADGTAAGAAGNVDVSAFVAATVAAVKRDLLASANAGPPPARDGVEGVIAMWGTALRIDATIDDDVWCMLDEDNARTTTVIDVLSEGFTNAVRHGSGTAVSADIRPSADGTTVVVEIRSRGSLAEPAMQGGIGLAGLRASAAELSIRTESEHVVLTVTLA